MTTLRSHFADASLFDRLNQTVLYLFLALLILDEDAREARERRAKAQPIMMKVPGRPVMVPRPC